LESYVVDSPHRSVTRAIVLSACDSIPQGWAGRQLAGLYRSMGLMDVTAVPRAFLSTFAVFELVFQSHVARLCATGVIDTEDAERWWTDLHEAEASGRFLAAITAFVVAGTKPGTSAVVS
jgi:hypothetical protein